MSHDVFDPITYQVHNYRDDHYFTGPAGSMWPHHIETIEMWDELKRDTVALAAQLGQLRDEVRSEQRDDWLGELERRRGPTLAQRVREDYERAKAEAAKATDDYKPTCGDLYDLPRSLWFLVRDEATYAAAGTYVCDKEAGHKGRHEGKTVEGYREERQDDGTWWHLRRDEVEWTDADPLRRANR